MVKVCPKRGILHGSDYVYCTVCHTKIKESSISPFEYGNEEEELEYSRYQT